MGKIIKEIFFEKRVNIFNESFSGGIIVLYLCAQLAVLYTYNCLLILIYYWLGQNHFMINKYAVRSRYGLWPIKSVKN